MNVPAGVIQPKVPRPLTDEERHAIAASKERLEKLAQKFAKPERNRTKEKKHHQSAWG